MDTTNERRKHERLTFSTSLQVGPAGSAQRSAADACDLSVSGMSFRTRLPLSIGDEVRIHIANVVEHSSIAAHVRRVETDGKRYVVGVEHAPMPRA